MRLDISARSRVSLALAASGLVSVGLFAAGAIANHSLDFWYLPYNLVLAFLPLLFAIWLVRVLQKRPWKTWLPLLLTGLWIVFLPNSFYIISDFIHLYETLRIDVLLDVVMLTSFSFTGLAFGFGSLYMVHLQFVKRVGAGWAALLVALLLLLCSFAIYLGRDLRWNSWDIAVQPLALFADVADRLFDPLAHSQTFSTTLGFFVLLGSMYAVLWQTARLSSSNSSYKQSKNPNLQAKTDL